MKGYVTVTKDEKAITAMKKARDLAFSETKKARETQSYFKEIHKSFLFLKWIETECYNHEEIERLDNIPYISCWAMSGSVICTVHTEPLKALLDLFDANDEIMVDNILARHYNTFTN